MTMPTPAEDAALAAFIDAAISDEDPGYPCGAAFVPWQETPDTSWALRRYLDEGRPVVIVDADRVKTIIEPVRR